MSGAESMQNGTSSARGASQGGVRAAPERITQVEVWGILNVTPDSFSDGGKYVAVDAALERAEVLAGEGATVIDVGGASSRPKGGTYGDGAPDVPVDEEVRRVLPVCRELVRRGHRVSVDTTRPEVFRSVAEVGVRIANDVSMGASSRLLELVAEFDAELVLMHTRLDGRVDASTTGYRDVVVDVLDELGAARERALGAGVAASRVWIDPGLGFAKTAEQSMALLAATDRLVATGWPVLVAASRKSFLGAHARELDGSVPPPSDRLGASVAAVCCAVWGGARAVRVHDVRASRQAIQIAMAASSRGGGT